ncbi:DUF4783 domain-containing protein [Treponema sp. OMZ 787]|uniref:DUF4783 domain-containing protein n=1 Tax=Treponema sp. OMZ 787 TaxID=2563669 RepID=UPI0020A468DA|nr:DUF4783 domain-containing protein [Treponema sp. OMZ 787]UTC62596.1 DUF4783 domain-containing protein [Treponema sp. OMZ 787]
MIIIEALQEALSKKGIVNILKPQASTVADAHAELGLIGLTVGGEKKDNNIKTYETLTLSCDIVSLGVSIDYVKEVSKFLKKMLELCIDSLDVPLIKNNREYLIKAHFQKVREGSFEYPEDSQVLPAEYREGYIITMTYPSFLNEEE